MEELKEKIAVLNENQVIRWKKLKLNIKPNNLVAVRGKDFAEAQRDADIKWFKEHNYVQLDDDQSLPQNPMFNESTNVEFKAFMRKANFRKVK